MKQKFTIKKITLIFGTEFKEYEVGINGVTQIIDQSMEYENSIEFIYAIFLNNYQRFQIINCSIAIEFFEPEHA